MVTAVLRRRRFHNCHRNKVGPDTPKNADAQRIALLLKVRSIVNITLTCKEGGEACALAPSQTIYTVETTFGAPITPDDSSPPSSSIPVAGDMEPPLSPLPERMRRYADGGTGRRDGTRSGGERRVLADLVAHALAGAVAGGLGELSAEGINSWLAPSPEDLIRTVGGDPSLIAAINSDKDLGWEAGEA